MLISLFANSYENSLFVDKHLRLYNFYDEAHKMINCVKNNTTGFNPVFEHLVINEMTTGPVTYKGTIESGKRSSDVVDDNQGMNLTQFDTYMKLGSYSTDLPINPKQRIVFGENISREPVIDRHSTNPVFMLFPMHMTDKGKREIDDSYPVIIYEKKINKITMFNFTEWRPRFKGIELTTNMTTLEHHLRYYTRPDYQDEPVLVDKKCEVVSGKSEWLCNGRMKVIIKMILSLNVPNKDLNMITEDTDNMLNIYEFKRPHSNRGDMYYTNILGGKIVPVAPLSETHFEVNNFKKIYEDTDNGQIILSTTTKNNRMLFVIVNTFPNVNPKIQNAKGFFDLNKRNWEEEKDQTIKMLLEQFTVPGFH